jgi:zinc/manganese transport system substrate-binding protein
MLRMALLAGFLAASAALPAAAWAADRATVIATFSILGDFAERIGGEHVQVLTLVGPNGDAHVFQPGPRESAALAKASVLVANGLEFEPWLLRLGEASGFKGELIVASAGIVPLATEEEHDEDHEGEAHEGDAHADAEHEEEAEADHHHGAVDPHAFQDLANARIYVANIAQGLSEAVPGHAADFKVNAETLSAEIAALDAELKAAFAAVPQERRRVLTSHDAFRYFGRAYGIEFVSVQGVSTEAEPTAEDLAKIVRQARDGQLSAIFLENMSDPRLADMVAQESGIEVGGELYADALSEPDGPAPDYLSLIRHNAKQLLAVMQ